MDQHERALVESCHRQALQEQNVQPAAITEPATISHAELPAAKPDDALFLEWNTYRREAARLLAEGHEGKWVLIKEEKNIGVWADHDEAYAVALDRFLTEKCLIHQIRDREPTARATWLI